MAQLIVSITWSYRKFYLFQSSYCAGDLNLMLSKLIAIYPWLEMLDYVFEGNYINFFINFDIVNIENMSILSNKLIKIFSAICNTYSLNKNRFLIDCFGVNIGKVVHHGNVRSGVVGNVFAKAIKLLGGVVTTDVHYGDYGDVLAIFVQYFHNRDINSIEKANLVELKQVYAYAKSLNITDITNILLKEDITDNVHTELMKITKKYVGKLCELFDFHFDLHCGEYDYRFFVKHLIKILKIYGLAIQREDNRVSVMCDKTEIILTRANGTPLYITNDIAALLSRSLLNMYDDIIYIADSRQEEHFELCFKFVTSTFTSIKIPNLQFIKIGIVRNENKLILRSRDGKSGAVVDYIEHLSYVLGINKKIITLGLKLYYLRHRTDREYILCEHLLKDCIIRVLDVHDVLKNLEINKNDPYLTTDEILFIIRVLQLPIIFSACIKDKNVHILYTHFMHISEILDSLKGVKIHQITDHYVKIFQQYYNGICLS